MGGGVGNGVAEHLAGDRQVAGHHGHARRVSSASVPSAKGSVPSSAHHWSNRARRCDRLTIVYSSVGKP
jgi:hypothetical protein